MHALWKDFFILWRRPVSQTARPNQSMKWHKSRGHYLLMLNIAVRNSAQYSYNGCLPIASIQFCLFWYLVTAIHDTCTVQACSWSCFKLVVHITKLETWVSIQSKVRLNENISWRDGLIMDNFREKIKGIFLSYYYHCHYLENWRAERMPLVLFFTGSSNNDTV